MPDTLTVALLQLTSGIDPAGNARQVCDLIDAAAERGADWVLTPEMTLCLDKSRRRLLSNTHAEPDDPGLKAVCERAAARAIHVLIGSMAVRVGPASDGTEKLANRSLLIGPDGAIQARYDKIHLFDVTVSETESYRESRLYAPGDAAVVAQTPWGGVGLSVCYDVRFPHLYRALGQAGAGLLTVPSAFTVPTGRAHWHVLLRARAIETGCFVLAPAQGGDHGDGRSTYGHSLVVDPWGEIVLDAGAARPETTPGLHLADLDLAAIDRTRQRIPSLNHGRAFRVPE